MYIVTICFLSLCCSVYAMDDSDHKGASDACRGKSLEDLMGQHKACATKQPLEHDTDEDFLRLIKAMRKLDDAQEHIKDSKKQELINLMIESGLKAAERYVQSKSNEQK